MTTEIKNKEESLSALMSRILREPLDPLNKSINDTIETLLETKDKLDDIGSSISGNGNLVEDMSKSLRRALNNIKDEVLPDHAQSIQQQVKALSETSSKQVLDSIVVQQQSIDILKDILNTTHNTVLSEIYATQELNRRAITELTRLAAQNEESGKSLVDQSESLRAIYARLADVKQASTNAMESNQAAMILMLTEQYSALTAHLVLVQTKLQTLTIAAGVFVMSILGYVGYGVWSKLI